MSLIKWAIIGCGSSSKGRGGAHSISYCHATAVRGTNGLHLCAAVSRTKQNIDDFCEQYPGVKGYQDYKEMLASEKPDIVSICTFPKDREEHVLDVINSGVKAILVEKPLAMNKETMQRILDAAKAKNVRLFVNLQRRYGLPFQWLKNAVEDGSIGKVHTLNLSIPVPSILDFGTHLMDTALFVLGNAEVDAVHAAVDANDPMEWHFSKSESQITAAVYFKNGVLMNFSEGRKSSPLAPIFRADGTEGFAEILFDDPDNGKSSVFRMVSANTCGVVSPFTKEHFHHSEDGVLYMRRCVADIRDAFLTGKSTLVDVENAVHGLNIIFAMFESAKTNKVIKF